MINPALCGEVRGECSQIPDTSTSYLHTALFLGQDIQTSSLAPRQIDRAYYTVLVAVDKGLPYIPVISSTYAVA